MKQGMPQDPMIQQLIAATRDSMVSRRSLLRGAAIGAAGLGASSLAACSPGGSAAPAQGDGSAGSIVWGNWTYYLDFDAETGTWPTLDAFMQETDIDVLYAEDVDDNNTFYGKIKDALQLNQFTGYDTIVVGEWLNARLVRQEQVQELDHGNMPNVKANLVETQWDSLDVDPGRHYTIPWQQTGAGFVWNTEAVPGGIHTLDDLLKPELKGKVGLLSDMRNTMGLIMGGLGIDPAGDWGDADFDRALGWIDDGIKSGQISQIKGNSYTQDLQTDVMLAGFAWTGDMVALNFEEGNRWTLEIPESGGVIDGDSFSVPNGTSAENKGLVEELINYYYDPEVAAQVVEYVGYITPVVGAQEAMEKLDPEIANDPLIFPDEAMLSRLHRFRTLTPEEDNKYSAAFAKVLGM